MQTEINLNLLKLSIKITAMGCFVLKKQKKMKTFQNLSTIIDAPGPLTIRKEEKYIFSTKNTFYS